MNCHSTISVKELLGTSIHTREASAVLMHLVQNDPCAYVELDFSSIEYISRSFADQFHFDKIKYAAELQKTIVVSNAPENVIKMLQAVARSLNTSSREIDNVPVYKYSSSKELDNFLLSF